ncbi:hypothetical protein JBF12_06875 [Streptomyces javensis]|uniref:Helix-turn-helix domain-containing protein n=2 Tax=Streptomyces javensis TaxID=114698 RepID=A0ABS0R5Q5_9ACTN|nr:hypothetical protein [Streptomyces javensis]
MRRSAWCKNAGELAALLAIANFVREDLTGCWASQRVLAEKARVTDRTIRTHLRSLAERSVIVPGDPALVAHLSGDNRPDVWNLNRDLPTNPPGTGKDFRSSHNDVSSRAGKIFRSAEDRGTGKFYSGGPENPSDDPVMVDPGSASGDGRRPSSGGTGRAGRGKAALSKEPQAKRLPAGELRRVVAGIPATLAARLESEFPRGLPTVVNETIARAVVEERRTVEQIIERVKRRWLRWSYEDDALATSGRGLGRPLGVLQALLGPSACWGNNARCEDGIDIDTGVECPRCVEAREDKTAQETPTTEGGGHSVPFQRPVGAEPSPYVRCRGAGCGVKMWPSEDGLCRECREYVRA